METKLTMITLSKLKKKIIDVMLFVYDIYKVHIKYIFYKSLDAHNNFFFNDSSYENL